jgi:hypothetical protein
VFAVTSDKLAVHLQVSRYDDFRLTDAIRPGPGMPVVPRQGYRRDVYCSANGRLQVPVLAAAVSREHLFDLFLDLLEPLGPSVDVVLETSHGSENGAHKDLLREDIDLPVLASHFCEFESLLLNDGCAGTAVISTAGPMEVQFDEHKLLVVYARDLSPFELILGRYGVRRDDKLRLITEGEHLHSSDPCYVEQFEQLCSRIGIGQPAERVNW